jgi:hypothetical protein
MTTTRMSSQQINALAFLMHELRPEWDTPGCVAALRRCPEVGLGDLMIAVAKGAVDPANDTPAALVHLNNRAWDSDWYLPCKAHPNTRARRTNGECAACWTDRQVRELEAEAERAVTIQRMPQEARDKILAAIDASLQRRHHEAELASRQTPPTEERKDEEAVGV